MKQKVRIRRLLNALLIERAKIAALSKSNVELHKEISQLMLSDAERKHSWYTLINMGGYPHGS